MAELESPRASGVLVFDGPDRVGDLGPRDGSAIVAGDAHEVLVRLPAGMFQTCVTSPPYWSLRDYGIPGQIGLELSLDDYVESLVKVF
ncbi:MAG: site-specific DNA-methyltransferase, partial [Actinomycetota bacterium]|nr:site-specific DNA-methyltransferase [Actinomycetota bacterium]